VSDAYEALGSQLEDALVRRWGPVDLQAHDVTMLERNIPDRGDRHRVGVRLESVGEVLPDVVLLKERLAPSTRQVKTVPCGLRRVVEDQGAFAKEIDRRITIHQLHDALQGIPRDGEGVDGTVGKFALVEDHGGLNSKLMEKGFLNRALVNNLPFDRFLHGDRVLVGEGSRAIHDDGKEAIAALAEPVAERVGVVDVDLHSDLAGRASAVLDERDGVASRRTSRRSRRGLAQRSGR